LYLESRPNSKTGEPQRITHVTLKKWWWIKEWIKIKNEVKKIVGVDLRLGQKPP